MGRAGGFFKGVKKISEGVNDFFLEGSNLFKWRGLGHFLVGRCLFSVVETSLRGEFFS